MVREAGRTTMRSGVSDVWQALWRAALRGMRRLVGGDAEA
jgi:hypothetical protein